MHKFLQRIFLKPAVPAHRLSTHNTLINFFAASIYSSKLVRNIGISAHIDSGKTTFTERVLYYGGRINAIHEVKGGDNVGATMDFMELEREKGITIQSAATHVRWGDKHINIIDTPGHVDFTIEVERALRVLDAAIMIVCGVGGVQPQTLTVDKQMKRYKIPRLIFINKLDRLGASPWGAIKEIRDKLGLNVAAVQIPIGLDSSLKGIIDIIGMKAYYFDGPKGDFVREEPIPDNCKDEADEKRQELIEVLANNDPTIEDLYLHEKEITQQILEKSIRKQTLDLQFCPVFMGSAYKNKGVQLTLDGVVKFLPNPEEMKNIAYRQVGAKEEEIVLETNSRQPFVGYAFKLEENKFGQLTYVRVYQGKLKRGEFVYNVAVKKRLKVSRMVRMHANQMEDISEIEAGDIFATFGLECSTGDTLTDGNIASNITCSTMFVPQPVMSLSIKPTKNEFSTKMQKALSRFVREDPTFHVNVDKESEEIIISGMGELHLQIYAERMRREFEIDVKVGAPTVNYRETVSSREYFDFLHKKQSGGAGQYARVIGYIEPLVEGVNNLIETNYFFKIRNFFLKSNTEFANQFKSEIVGTTIPNEYVTACEKGFYESVMKGPLTGYPVVNVKYVLQDGATHVVDSSSNAFMIATRYSFQNAFPRASPQILEPIMTIEITVPQSAYV